MVMNKQNAGCSHFFGPLGRMLSQKFRVRVIIVPYLPQLWTDRN